MIEIFDRLAEGVFKWFLEVTFRWFLFISGLCWAVVVSWAPIYCVVASNAQPSPEFKQKLEFIDSHLGPPAVYTLLTMALVQAVVAGLLARSRDKTRSFTVWSLATLVLPFYTPAVLFIESRATITFGRHFSALGAVAGVLWTAYGLFQLFIVGILTPFLVALVALMARKGGGPAPMFLLGVTVLLLYTIAAGFLNAGFYSVSQSNRQSLKLNGIGSVGIAILQGVALFALIQNKEEILILPHEILAPLLVLYALPVLLMVAGVIAIIGSARLPTGSVPNAMTVTDKWFFDRDGKITGPLSLDILMKFLAKGILQPTSLIRKGTEGDWVEAHTIGELSFSTPLPPSSDVPWNKRTVQDGQRSKVRNRAPLRWMASIGYFMVAVVLTSVVVAGVVWRGEIAAAFRWAQERTQSVSNPGEAEKASEPSKPTSEPLPTTFDGYRNEANRKLADLHFVWNPKEKVVSFQPPLENDNDSAQANLGTALGIGRTVEWRAKYLGREHGATLKFDLPDMGDFFSRTEFTCAPEEIPVWDAVPKDQEVTFSGLIDLDMTVISVQPLGTSSTYEILYDERRDFGSPASKYQIGIRPRNLERVHHNRRYLLHWRLTALRPVNPIPSPDDVDPSALRLAKIYSQVKGSKGIWPGPGEPDFESLLKIIHFDAAPEPTLIAELVQAERKRYVYDDPNGPDGANGAISGACGVLVTYSQQHPELKAELVRLLSSDRRRWAFFSEPLLEQLAGAGTLPAESCEPLLGELPSPAALRCLSQLDPEGVRANPKLFARLFEIATAKDPPVRNGTLSLENQQELISLLRRVWPDLWAASLAPPTQELLGVVEQWHQLSQQQAESSRYEPIHIAMAKSPVAAAAAFILAYKKPELQRASLELLLRSGGGPYVPKPAKVLAESLQARTITPDMPKELSTIIHLELAALLSCGAQAKDFMTLYARMQDSLAANPQLRLSFTPFQHSGFKAQAAAMILGALKSESLENRLATVKYWPLALAGTPTQSTEFIATMEDILETEKSRQLWIPALGHYTSHGRRPDGALPTLKCFEHLPRLLDECEVEEKKVANNQPSDLLRPIDSIVALYVRGALHAPQALSVDLRNRMEAASARGQLRATSLQN